MAKKRNVCGIYRLKAREVVETHSLFTEMPAAQPILARLREMARAAGENPYDWVILPCGPKNEGLLPLP